MFADDELVLQSHPLIDGVEVPLFGRMDMWPLVATRKPANVAVSAWCAPFTGLEGVWNLRAREVAMVLLNPRHPAVLAAGINRKARPASVSTVFNAMFLLRHLASWAAGRGLSADLAEWQDDDVRAWVDHRRGELSASGLVGYVSAARLLHQLGPVLTGGGLARDPWRGQSARQVVDLPVDKTVRTPNIDPQVWHALVKAAWTYVHTFAPDILKARARAIELEQAAIATAAGLEARVDQYLADPDNIIPLHPPRYLVYCNRHQPGEFGTELEVNWSFLGVLLGIRREQRALTTLTGYRSHVGRARAKILQAVREGRGRPGGLVDSYATVTRPDGSIGPWHPGLSPRGVREECVTLRAACYVMVAALSMMRDSEIREITRGSVVEHYGASAVASMKRKHDPNQPREHWWIIEPVAEAIAVAEAISRHVDLVFSSDVGGGVNGESVDTEAGFKSGQMVSRFIERINDRSEFTGLTIPEGHVAPHMFRKTMAMLTATEPSAEIALGLQLKHAATRALANRSTQGYMATDTTWAKLLDSAVDDIRFTRLREFYDDYHSGKAIGFGPGAERMMAAFDTIRRTAQARQGDARVEYDILRKTRISIRLGKLNHCMFDENSPAGAKCLEEAIVPEGHRGPLVDRCQPGRCANSVIGREHLPIWKAEQHSLLTLLDQPKIAPCRRAALQNQLEDVKAVIRKAES
ncbi:integrase [Streptomyces sp. RB6PN25]|uniref:Integrase n=1 Tax=Streptomyces humicola TaxID=2953240 RepID=A0ABT1PWD3_9ACTN|nr:integrase [Streptomyces humicola]